MDSTPVKDLKTTIGKSKIRIEVLAENGWKRSHDFFFCEPFFHAIQRWMRYSQQDLFSNRIRTMDALVRIIGNNDVCDDNIGISMEVDKTALLPSVIPTAGIQYKPTFDVLAFEAAKSLVEYLIPLVYTSKTIC